MNLERRCLQIKQNFFEQQNSVIYVARWSFLGITTGVIVGLGVSIFLKLLAWSIAVWSEVWYYYFFLPIILFFVSWLVGLLAPHPGGSNKVIEVLHQPNGKLQLADIPVKIAATIVTIAAGGSAGKEGPAAHIGATLASSWAKMLRLQDADWRKVVTCGLSAGFACVFGTPVAGAVFGVEVLFVGKILYNRLYPAFLAGMVGYYVCYVMGIPYFSLPVRVEPNGYLIVQAIFLGVLCGLISIFFIKTVNWCRQFFAFLPLPAAVKGMVGGGMLILIGYFISPLYLGLGLELLETSITGIFVAPNAFFWKTLATGITLGCGGIGGIITPVIIVGAAAGNLFGQLVGSLNLSVYAVIGLAALLAGAVNTPLAAVIMAAELFGSDVIPYTAISCLISYVISGHRSVYPSQIIFASKRTCLCEDEGKPVGYVGRAAATAASPSKDKLLAGSYLREENTMEIKQ
ncbi:Chloride/fluoride channel protein [Sporomusa acidovorans DSM 3132]|uniref:Chloride/fluoride channel protein n=2 Tax=Sporomusa TaxID=2375 RepID=A0ABZ3J069_SPOA4|nr:chloride/fluoride channel protein [Sporomusa acidovorans DSM 3132]SDF85597.1 H+/Cl-antiporter ClcA [Sporomusa acidovorans]